MVGTLPDTERRNRRSEHIDELPVEAMLRVINGEDAGVAGKVAAEIPHIARAVEAAERALRAGGRVVYIGCGTSGRLGVLDAAECPPTYGVAPGLFVGLIAGGDTALRHSVEGAEDDGPKGEQDLARLAPTPKDFVVGLAASGRTPYVLAALAFAQKAGAATALITCAKIAPPPPCADILIAVDTGAEIITGSTRMKAGTAQKMVLNMISTGAMVRLGKVFGNLMVDLRPTNAKLVDRACRIIMEVTGCPYPEAQEALTGAEGSVKPAILALRLGVDSQQAQSLLAACGGRLGEALRRAGV
jgi:N-acetylmuramic acid 6-phosphate etherase